MRNNILDFARVGLGVREVWKDQRELLLAVEDSTLRRPQGRKRVAAKSGQGPGKTTALVIAGLWRGFRHIRSRAVCTAPAQHQVRDVFLAEARKWVDRGHPLIRELVDVQASRIVFGGDNEWSIRTVTACRAENSQGRHDDNLTILIDEASGIEREVWETWEGTTTGSGNMILAVGNPNTRDCPFFDCFSSARDRWRTLTLNAENAPDWLVDKENHRYLESKYGRESDVYRVRVLGEFPRQDPRCIMSQEDLDACSMLSALTLSQREPLRGTSPRARVIAIDFARFGGDESVIIRRQGCAILEMDHYIGEEPDDVFARACELQRRCGWSDNDCVYVFDAGGMGQPMIRRIQEAGKRVFPFISNARASDSQFENLISEAWFRTADYVKEHVVAIPRDSLLIQQLCTRYYRMTKHGRIAVESKDEYARRGFASPDRADALVMALYDEVAAVTQITEPVEGKVVGFRPRPATRRISWEIGR